MIQRLAWYLVTFMLLACGEHDFNQNEQEEETTDQIEKRLGSSEYILNLDELILKLGLGDFHKSDQTGQGIKIAILDNGFKGLDSSRGKTLPPDVFYDKGNGSLSSDNHGTYMAQTVYSLATGSRVYKEEIEGPELYLYNANGLENFESAIKKVISLNPDIVLYSQSWDFGGNFDGKGYINAMIDEAVDHGILWVNAAGNYGENAWRGPLKLVDKGKETWVDLPGAGEGIQIKVKETTRAWITVSWNDFRNDINYATPQDLDLFIYKGDQVVGMSNFKQNGIANSKADKWSGDAYELFNQQLTEGTYTIKVKANTANFNQTSRINVSAIGIPSVTAIEFLTAPSFDTVPVAADNMRVLTVGANDASYSSKSKYKPELSVPSFVQTAGGLYITGSSSAAAVAVAAIAIKSTGFSKKAAEAALAGFRSSHLK